MLEVCFAPPRPLAPKPDRTDAAGRPGAAALAWRPRLAWGRLADWADGSPGFGALEPEFKSTPASEQAADSAADFPLAARLALEPATAPSAAEGAVEVLPA